MPEKGPKPESSALEKMMQPIKSRVSFPENDYFPVRKRNGLQLAYVTGITNALIHYGTIDPEVGQYILNQSENHYGDLFDSEAVEEGKIGKNSVSVVKDILEFRFGLTAEINSISRHRSWKDLEHELERDRSIIIGNKKSAVLLNGLIDSGHESRVIAPDSLTGKTPRLKVSIPEIYDYIRHKDGIIISVH